MQVKVTREFRAVPAGHVYPETFPVGGIVDGRIADIALELKSGEKIADEAVSEPTARGGETSTPGETQGTANTGAEGEDETSKPDDEAKQPDVEKKPDGPKTIIVRARLKDKYEGPDDKGKAIKIAKGGVVSAPLAQKLVDEGLANVLETKTV